MLILEGPDLVGKTTLAVKLVKLCETELDNEGDRPLIPHPVIYSHFTRLPSRWDYLTHYLGYLTTYTVQDRFHLSELVYGDVHRGATSLKPEMLRILEAQLALLASYTVVVTADEDWIRGAWEREVAAKGREEMYDLETVIKVNYRYVQLMRGEIEHYGHAHVDVHLHLHRGDKWPSDNAEFIQSILQGWSYRLSEAERWGVI